MPTSPSESPESPTRDDDKAASTHQLMPTPQGTKRIPDRKYGGDGWVVVRMLFGSWAHGTQNQHSDEDWRGIFQLPNDAFLGFSTPQTTWEAKPDQVYHELGHYMRLLGKGNPNIVGMPFVTPDVVFEHNWVWEDLVENREQFISQQMVRAYRGWIFQELESFEKGKTVDNPKRLSHVPRLAYELYHAVLYRFIPVRVRDRMLDFVMDVKDGRAGVKAVRLEVDGLFDAMESSVAQVPDIDKEWLQERLLMYRRG